MRSAPTLPVLGIALLSLAACGGKESRAKDFVERCFEKTGAASQGYDEVKDISLKLEEREVKPADARNGITWLMDATVEFSGYGDQGMGGGKSWHSGVSMFAVEELPAASV